MTRILTTLLLATLLLGGCRSIDPAVDVKLSSDDYPPTIGPNYDAVEVATFVTKRTKLAKQLFLQEDGLNDSIHVLEDLLRHVPSSVRNRYDLGTMYYQRAHPKIREYRALAAQVTILQDKSKVESDPKLITEAEDKQKALGEVYKAFVPDIEKALDQFLVYAQKMPQDPRPADMIWRCYIAVEEYEKALQMLNRVIKWPNVIPDDQREDYIAIQRFLRAHLLQTRKLRGEIPMPRLNNN